jgi:hypothetical protein
MPSAPTNRPSAGPPSPRSRTSAGKILGFVAGFIVLAAVGATLGWTLTSVPSASAAAPPTLSESASAGQSGTSAPPPTQTQPAPGPTTLGNRQFQIPDYAAAQTLFRDARDELRNHGIAVELIFASTGNAQTVNHTDPAAGSPGPRGITVKIFVNGVAPLLGVPPIPSDTRCSVWGRQLASIGFQVANYNGDRSKPVTSESPDQNDPTTVWNQQITLTCGDKAPPPSASPSQTPDPGPTASPSPSGGP